MPHFYGRIQGARHVTTRQGSKSSGMVVAAYSAEGGVKVSLYVDREGRDCALVELVPHPSGGGKTVRLYDGPVDEATRRTLGVDTW